MVRESASGYSCRLYPVLLAQGPSTFSPLPVLSFSFFLFGDHLLFVCRGRHHSATKHSQWDAIRKRSFVPFLITDCGGFCSVSQEIPYTNLLLVSFKRETVYLWPSSSISGMQNRLFLHIKVIKKNSAQKNFFSGTNFDISE